MSEYFWVIGGGLLQVPLAQEVRALGYRPIVSDANERCPARPHADVFVHADIFDIDAHLAAVRQLESEGRRIAGVLAAGIDAPETMAVVAHELGLPGVDPEIARIVSHKDEFRAALERLGFPVPRYRVVTPENVAEVPAMVREVGFPLIVKNTSSSGSRGTRIFREPDLQGVLATVDAAMTVSRSGHALIEEVWDGPEQTVETLFDAEGRFHRCFITDRLFDKTYGYALEIELRHPTTLPAEAQEQLYSLAERAARAFGVRIGAAKFDTMTTAAGPRILEMTVRLSGGFDCQYLVPAATGKNVLRAAVLTALGRPFPFELLEDTRHRIAISSSIWPQPGTVIAVEGEDAVREVPGCEHLFFRRHVGDVVEPYVDCTKRVCFVIVSGETEAAARASLDEVRGRLRIVTEPVRLAT